MRKVLNPTGIAKPASAYNHALLIEPVRALLTMSGQLGERPDGSCPPDAEAQTQQAWSNIEAILTEAGMDFSNITKVTSYIVGEEHIDAYVGVHKDILGDLMPPWKLVVVAALGNPQYLVEVDVTAAA